MISAQAEGFRDEIRGKIDKACEPPKAQQVKAEGRRPRRLREVGSPPKPRPRRALQPVAQTPGSTCRESKVSGEGGAGGGGGGGVCVGGRRGYSEDAAVRTWRARVQRAARSRSSDWVAGRLACRVLLPSTHLQEGHGGCRCMHEQTNGLRVRTACAGGQATTRGSPPAGSISAVSARVKS